MSSGYNYDYNRNARHVAGTSGYVVNNVNNNDNYYNSNFGEVEHPRYNHNMMDRRGRYYFPDNNVNGGNHSIATNVHPNNAFHSPIHFEDRSHNMRSQFTNNQGNYVDSTPFHVNDSFSYQYQPYERNDFANPYHTQHQPSHNRNPGYNNRMHPFDISFDRYDSMSLTGFDMGDPMNFNQHGVYSPFPHESDSYYPTEEGYSPMHPYSEGPHYNHTPAHPVQEPTSSYPYDDEYHHEYHRESRQDYHHEPHHEYHHEYHHERRQDYHHEPHHEYHHEPHHERRQDYHHEPHHEYHHEPHHERRHEYYHDNRHESHHEYHHDSHYNYHHDNRHDYHHDNLLPNQRRPFRQFDPMAYSAKNTHTMQLSSEGFSNTSEETHGIVKGMPQYGKIKQDVDEAVGAKTDDIHKARVMLEQLTQKYPNCHLVWMELSRLEMEQGNVRKCREILLKGLEHLPQSEPLLEKRIKVEERLRNYKGVIECANEFLKMNSPRCVKSIVEAAIVVAKLGYGYEASKLFKSLEDKNFFTQGGVTLDYIRFLFKTENYQQGLEKLVGILDTHMKHGPIWFFTFSVLEQHHTILWCRKNIQNRCNNNELTLKINQALNCLDPKLHWKIYYIAAQAQLRSFTHIRLRARNWKRVLGEYINWYPHVIERCLYYLECCVRCCEVDFKWKVWLLAGRVEALAGNVKKALACLVRSTDFAPMDHRHAVCLELARILDFIGTPEKAGEVIQKNILEFPDEWKLVLERIHQLLRENQIVEAYELNRVMLNKHQQAGRLWSSFIQLTHQLHGSTKALLVFYASLMYVAKSGEVWCEGARIFMNPLSMHFNPLNAQRCLSFAVFFTPQYGDSFIEAFRLSMITSEELLVFGRTNSPSFLSAILSARNYRSIINKCVYSDPNYGSCWFRAKLFPLGSAEEVAFRAIKFTAHEIAITSNIYYDAMNAFAKRVHQERTTGEIPENKNKLGIRDTRFSYAFPPYQMITSQKPLTIAKKLKILFGTSQIES